jgi:hypothetical protein
MPATPRPRQPRLPLPAPTPPVGDNQPKHLTTSLLLCDNIPRQPQPPGKPRDPTTATPSRAANPSRGRHKETNPRTKDAKHMRKLMTISVAIAAIAALSAIASSIAGAAFPRYLPSGNGTLPQHFTGFSGKGTLAIRGGNTITCEKNKDKGEIINDTNLVVETDFEECTIFGIAGAHSLGDAANTILVTSRGLLCEIEANVAGVVLTPTGKVHIEAAGALSVVEGSVIGVLTPSSGLTLEFRLTLKQREAGVQEQKKCKNPTVETHLNASEGEREAREASEATNAVLGLLGTTGELMT